MTNIWHHIFPSNFYPKKNSLTTIDRENYILEFKNTEFGEIDLHVHNKTSYVGNNISKDFVEAIYLVVENLGDSLKLQNISDQKEVIVLKENLENGRFYISSGKDLKKLLPYNWN